MQKKLVIGLIVAGLVVSSLADTALAGRWCRWRSRRQNCQPAPSRKVVNGEVAPAASAPRGPESASSFFRIKATNCYCSLEPNNKFDCIGVGTNEADARQKLNTAVATCCVGKGAGDLGATTTVSTGMNGCKCQHLDLPDVFYVCQMSYRVDDILYDNIIAAANTPNEAINQCNLAGQQLFGARFSGVEYLLWLEHKPAE